MRRISRVVGLDEPVSTRIQKEFITTHVSIGENSIKIIGLKYNSNTRQHWTNLDTISIYNNNNNDDEKMPPLSTTKLPGSFRLIILLVVLELQQLMHVSLDPIRFLLAWLR